MTHIPPKAVLIPSLKLVTPKLLFSKIFTTLRVNPLIPTGLPQSDKPVKTLPKNASLEHEYYKHIVAEDYRKQGYTVKEEVLIGGGKAVDLVATKDGKRIAIEIETGKSDMKANIRKCHEAGFEVVLSMKV